MKGKPEITIMTLLAIEATNDAQLLLKKYGFPRATSIKDLEQKLAELYFRVPDKVQFEKELAAIHPHKKWLNKTLSKSQASKPEEITTTELKEIKPVVIKEEKVLPTPEEIQSKHLNELKEELKKTIQIELEKKEEKSNFYGSNNFGFNPNQNCPCGCQRQQMSSFNASETNQKNDKSIEIPFLGLIAAIGIFGLAFYAIAKIDSKQTI